MSVQALLLTQKAEVKPIKLTLEKDGRVILATIQKALKKKELPTEVGTYTYRNLTLFLFGFTKGRAGTENKHELPPPLDQSQFFGDLLLLASKEEATFETAVPFKSEDYEAFYTKAFGGGEEDEDEEVEEEETYEEEEAAGAEPEEKGFLEEEEEGVVEGSEEDEEDEEEGEEVGGEGGEEEEAAPISAAPKSRKKRTSAQKSANTYTNSSNVYASFPNVPPEEQLQEEHEPIELTEPRRIQILHSLEHLFAKILSPTDLSSLERSIYNGTIRDAHQRHIPCHWKHPLFLHTYVTYARHMAANFHPESYVKNKELFERYKKGEVSFDSLCGMNSYELFQSRWKDLFEQQQIREKRQLEGNKSMATDQFLCTRCWKRECTYYEMQTRSADEPMTIFITCLNCGKHWRQ